MRKLLFHFYGIDRDTPIDFPSIPGSAHKKNDSLIANKKWHVLQNNMQKDGTNQRFFFPYSVWHGLFGTDN